MTASRLKRSITVAGHRTSFSLEPEFWTALQEAARQEGIAVAAIVAGIDRARDGQSLSSAVRVWVLARLTRRTGAA